MMILDSKKVKKALRDKGLTQKDVADEIGVNPSTISDWIKGHAVPSNLNLQSLAQILEIDPDELINEQNNESSINIPTVQISFANATINIGSSSSMPSQNQNDEKSDSNVSINIDSNIFDLISKQAQGTAKEFIEDIIKKHFNL